MSAIDTTANTDPDSVMIAGAGIVGVSCALWCQRAGLNVTLADQSPPGSGASFGNAGTIATYGCVPVNSPALFRSLPKMLTTRHGPLRVDLPFALKNLPWMMSFLRNCTPARVRHISDALGDLLSRTYAGLTPLIEQAGARDLIAAQDFLYIWEKKASFETTASSIETRRRNGVAMQELNTSDIAALEPGLAKGFHAGVRFTGGEHVIDPQAFITRLFKSFTANGGDFIARNVRAIATDDDGVSVTLEDGTTHRTTRFVNAAGAHARSIAGSAAADLPLGTERGYHVMYADAANRVNRPLLWGEAGFYATPMAKGLRIAGTVEIDALDKPPRKERIDALKMRAEEMLGPLGPPTSSWLGFRPTMPDALPVIGQSHRSSRELLAFGHQHIGLTLGGITGRIIADLARNRQPNFDISPFSAERFMAARRRR
ncbi:MAG: FAD-binding oxidoreductase [Pseudomonadota bacterium]